jgi:hypothetical protein
MKESKRMERGIEISEKRKRDFSLFLFSLMCKKNEKEKEIEEAREIGRDVYGERKKWKRQRSRDLGNRLKEKKEEKGEKKAIWKEKEKEKDKFSRKRERKEKERVRKGKKERRAMGRERRPDK